MYEAAIVPPRWLGDLVMAVPAMRAIVRAESGPVALVGGTMLTEMLPWLGLEGAEAVSEIPKVRRCWLLRHSPRLALAARRRCKETIGSTHRLGWLLLTRAIRPRVDMRREHHRRYYLDLVRQAGIAAPEDEAPVLTPPPGAEEAGRAILARAGLKGMRVIAAAPGAQYGPAKQYPAPSFAHALGLLVEKGFAVALLGTAGEGKLAEAIAARLAKGKAANLAGKTTLHEALCVLAAAEGLVCNDSGLMHAAAALGKPTIAVFGATDPARTAPAGPKVRVLFRPAACSPCLKRRCTTLGQPCMSNVLPEEVAAAMEALL